MKSLIQFVLIAGIGLTSWYLSDMDSTSRLYSYVFPILGFISVVAFCLWLVGLASHIGERSKPHD